jgi:hypothetical protein
MPREAAAPLMLARSHGVPLIAVDALDDSVTLQLLASKQWLAKHPIAADAGFKAKMAAIAGGSLGRVSTTDQAFYVLLRSWGRTSARPRLSNRRTGFTGCDRYRD